LNRRHDARQAEGALDTLLSGGISNVTIDLIYGIPGMTQDEWKATLAKTFSTAITHLSAYHLTIEPGTVFGKMKQKGLLDEIDEEESAAQFTILTEMAAEAGFLHYEISNFGKPGFLSVHNTNYWKQIPYLGLGPSAHSFNRYSRQWNLSDARKYIKYSGTEKIISGREELDLKTRFNEYIMTSLRTMWGIDLYYTEQNFEKEGYDYVINIASKYISYGMMRQEKNALILTDQGMLISDNIISGFMMPGDIS
jgi:coproporphyrinogen III oxidase-like Fe-S oxidoreductase